MGFRYPPDEELPLWGPDRMPAGMGQRAMNRQAIESLMAPQGAPGPMYGPPTAEQAGYTPPVANYEPMPPQSLQPVGRQAMAPLPPGVRGSGTVNTRQIFSNDQNQSGYNYGRYPTETEYGDMTRIVRESPEVQAQIQGQALNRDLFRQQLTRQPQVDYGTPLANLHDLHVTGRLGTRQPISMSDPKALREWAKTLQDDQKDIANTIYAGVQKTKLGTETGMAMNQTRATDTQQVSPPEKFEKPGRAGKVLNIPPKQLEALSSIEGVRQMISDSKAIIHQHKDKFGPIEGMLRTANPYDDAARAIKAVNSDVMQTIGKLKEGGVLREHDEEKYRGMLPKLSDTYEVALEKIGNIHRGLEAHYTAAHGTLTRSGYVTKGLPKVAPIPGLSPRLGGGSPETKTVNASDPGMDAFLSSQGGH